MAVLSVLAQVNAKSDDEDFVTLLRSIQLALWTEHSADIAAALTAVQSADRAVVSAPIREWLNGAAEDLLWLQTTPAATSGPWLTEIPQPASAPTMVGQRERAYYTWLARTHAGGGSVVELGSWLGGVTACLADGLRRSPLGSGRVHAFDAFIWDDWMNNHFHPAGRMPAWARPGQSFLSEFQRHSQMWQDLVCVHQGSLGGVLSSAGLNQLTWDEGPIDILVNDFWDDDAVSRQVWTTFGPFLQPGGVVVINQFGVLPSVELRHFCREYRDVLAPLHKPGGPLRSFLVRGPVVG